MTPPARTLAVLLLSSLAARAEPPPGPPIGLSAGLDGGLSATSLAQRPAAPGRSPGSVKPTVGLGVDVGFYYLPSGALGLGLKFDAVLFGAGQVPSYGMNMAVGPSLVWRPGPVHLVIDPALVLSSFSDRCEPGTTPPRPGCVAPARAEPAAVGHGLAVSALLPVYRHPLGLDLLLGPTVRYHRASFALRDAPGHMDLPVMQVVLALHLFVSLADDRPQPR